MAEIGEVIAWLGAALRSSPQDHGVVYCNPKIDNLSIEAHEEEKTIAKSNICFQITIHRDQKPSGGINGCCWHGLFQNPVSVTGYPIRIKPQEDMEVEMPLEMMAGLVGSNRISSFAKKLFIKRFNAMLVLTKQLGDILIWHLLFNENGDHLSYADSRVCTADTQNCMSMLTEESTRHVLGWCSHIQNLAGEYSSCSKFRFAAAVSNHA